jgi:hypothetical protein
MLPAIIGFRAIMESEEMEEEARRCERTLDPRRVGVCVMKAATIGTASRKMSLIILTICQSPNAIRLVERKNNDCFLVGLDGAPLIRQQPYV